VSFIGKFEEAIVHYARKDEVDGVICGHIHSPIIREIDGVTYYNSGDWVESCSALLEDATGKIELITSFVVETNANVSKEQVQRESALVV